MSVCLCALFKEELHIIVLLVFLGFTDTNSPQSTSIFVGQLPFEIHEEELKLYFPGCLSARIMKDQYRGLSKG